MNDDLKYNNTPGAELEKLSQELEEQNKLETAELEEKSETEISEVVEPEEKHETEISEVTESEEKLAEEQKRIDNTWHNVILFNTACNSYKRMVCNNVYCTPVTPA